MLKFIKNMRKKKYVTPEKNKKIVINLDHYDSDNPYHRRIIENYHTMKNSNNFKKVCNY